MPPQVTALAERLAERIARHGPLPYDAFVDAALYDPDGGFYAARWRRRPAGRLPHRPRGRPAVRRRAGPGPRRVVATSWTAPTRTSWSTPAPAPARWPAACWPPGRRAPRRCATCSSSGRRRSGPGTPTATSRSSRRPRPSPAASGGGEEGEDEPAISSHRHRAARRQPRRPARRSASPASCWPTSCSTTCPSDWPSGTAAGTRRGSASSRGGTFVEVLVPPSGPLPGRPAGDGAPSAPGPPSSGRRRPGCAPPSTSSSGAGSSPSTTPRTRRRMAARPWREWLRTYRGHERGDHPLRHPGTQDITCDVALDQLASVQEPDAVRSQAQFLALHGLDDLVAEGRRQWAERAGGGRSGRRAGPQPGPGGRGAHRPERASAVSRWSNGCADRVTAVFHRG